MSAPMYGPRDRMSRALHKDFHESASQWSWNVPAWQDKQELLVCTYGFSPYEAWRWIGMSHAKFRWMLEMTDGDVHAADLFSLNAYQSGYVCREDCVKRLFWPVIDAERFCDAVDAGTEPENIPEFRYLREGGIL